MKYCVECGTKLISKHLENEGEIPFCPACNQFRFPIFNCAVSLIVMDLKSEKILLIKQYGRPNYILVAGYVNKGEGLIDTVRRELREETGLEAKEIRFNASEYFAPSNTLMNNFTVYVEDGSQIKINSEIDSFSWFDIEEARKNIYPKSLAEKFLLNYLDNINYKKRRFHIPGPDIDMLSLDHYEDKMVK